MKLPMLVCRWGAIVGTLPLYAGLTTVVQAQEARRVAYGPTCPSCRIDTTRVLTLGTPDDPVLLSPAVIPVRDSRGNHYAVSFDRAQIVRFTSDGKYAGVFGRRGEGPGEISQAGIAFLLVYRDSIFALQNGRLSVFSPDSRPIRSSTIPQGLITGAAMLSTGGIVVGATFRGASTFALPYHVLSPTGEVVRSFGDPKVHANMDRPEFRDRLDMPSSVFVLAPDQRSVWIATQYHVRQFYLNGSPGVAIDVTGAPWFPTPRETTIVARNGTAVSIPVGGGQVDVAGIDANGLLWVNAARPGSRALELFDPVGGSVKVSAKSAAWYRKIENGIGTVLELNADGVATFVLWRLRVVGLEESRRK